MLRTPPLRGGTLTTAVMQGAMGMLAVGFPLFAVQLGSTAEAGGALWAALETRRPGRGARRPPGSWPG